MKSRIRIALFAILGIYFTLPQLSYAAKFANQFAEFELPPQWQCNLEGAEWVCQSTSEDKKRDAVIVLAAKLKGDQDSLDQYLSYLKATKNFTSASGKQVKSEPKYAKSINLNNQAWVDALHLESEIPGFYTRYLATVKQDIGILVTYSINKAKYQDYLNDFDNMVKTLKVFRKAGGINVAPQNSNLFQEAQLPKGISNDTVFPGGNININTDAAKKPASQSNSTWIILLLAVGVVAFIIIKKKRSGS
ncbi:hypothetical protein EBS43_01375 [bacterium]|jgi:hypothetical protein|nr:hypothetical protein [bacterium]